MKLNQPFHLVKNSPWPIICSFCGLGMATGLLKFIFYENIHLFLFCLSLIFLLSYQWWRDIRWEGSIEGAHTAYVVNGLYLGIVIFILSEIFFFFLLLVVFSHKSFFLSRVGVLMPSCGSGFFRPLFHPTSQ